MKHRISILLLCMIVLMACNRSPSATTGEAATVPATAVFTPTPTSAGSPTPPLTPTPVGNPALVLDTGIPPNEIDALTVSEDGKILTLFHRKQTVKIWNLEAGTLLYDLPVENGEAGALFLSPNSRYLAVWMWDSRGGSHINTYRLEDGAFLQSTAWDGERPSLQFSPDGETFAIYFPEESVLATQSIYLFRTGDGAPLATITDPEARHIASAAFSPDGKTLATGALPGMIRFWRVSDGALLQSIDAHQDEVVSLSFSPDGKYLASKSWSLDPYTYIWRVSDGTLAHTLDGENWDPLPVFFPPNGKLIAAFAMARAPDQGNPMAAIKVWRVNDWAYLGFAPLEGEFHMAGIGFTPDGKYLLDRAAGLLWPLAETPFGELQPVQLEGPILTVWPDGAVITSDESGDTLSLWRATETPPPAATTGVTPSLPVPTASTTPPPTPTAEATPAALALKGPIISYNGITFLLDPALGHTVYVHDEQMYGSEVHYTRFTFAPDGYCREVGCVEVYPVEPYRAAFPDQPLPPLGAATILRAQDQRLRFLNGSGTRSLRMRGQDIFFANNEALVYDFQGFTDDSRYYVSIIIPIDAPNLLSTFDPEENTNPGAIPVPTELPDDYGQLGTVIQEYNREVERQLDLLAADAFTPRLNLLDEIATSLRIEMREEATNQPSACPQVGTES